MQLFNVYPVNDITITKAKGSYVYDEYGERYLDMYGGHAVISVGHNHPHYIHRLTEQLDQIGFYSNSVKIPLQGELARKLGQVSGKQHYQLFLCNSGAEANENALKLASFHTGRKKIVAFSKSFHGRTSLAVAATYNTTIIAPVNETSNVVFLPFNDIHLLQNYFRQHAHEIAGVIVEAIQGVGGIQVATEEFMQVIRRLCDEYGAVFIADEIQCGYGRTGRFFAIDHANVKADIYTTAKGMGNGFPVAGVIIAPHIKPKIGMLGSTFGGNQLACAAALAVLEIMEKERLMEHAEKIGEYLIHRLKQLPGIMKVRGKGLMIGFEIAEVGKDMRSKLLHKHHIFTGEAKPNVIRLLPPLNLEEINVKRFLNCVVSELKILPELV